MRERIGEIAELSLLVVFFLGLVLGLPILILGITWLLYVHWQGIGDNVAKLQNFPLFMEMLSQPPVWGTLLIILVLEGLIILRLRNSEDGHPHTNYF